MGGEGQRAAFDAVAVEEVESSEAGLVEQVPDVFGEIGADGVAGDSDAEGPIVGEGVDVGEASIAGVLEVGDDLVGREARGCECFGVDGPEGGDPDGSGEGVPLVREVEIEEPLAGAALAGVAIFEGEKGGVADEESGVGRLQHRFKIGGVVEEGGLDLPEAREEDAGVGGRGARGGIESDATDAIESVGMAHDEEDGADAVARGDGAAGDDGKRGREGECGDGNESNVGNARGEFGGAFGGGVEGEAVTLGEAGAVRFVVEGPHERGGIEEADGGDAETGQGIGGHWLV